MGDRPKIGSGLSPIRQTNNTLLFVPQDFLGSLILYTLYTQPSLASGFLIYRSAGLTGLHRPMNASRSIGKSVPNWKKLYRINKNYCRNAVC